MSSFSLPTIKRYPFRKDELLQGWDSADELLLKHVAAADLTGKRILIVNDQFGALSCGLEGLDCTTYTDSYVSWMGIRTNSGGRLVPRSRLEELAGPYDLVLLRVPKNMSFFEDILCHLTRHLGPGAELVCGAMVKHLAPAAFDLLNRYIGTTSTSLAEKKARLVFARFEHGEARSPYPQEVRLDGFETPFTHHSNLFSRDRLDVGTRFFLEHLPRGPFAAILDLGCANGVVGVRAKLLNPGARITFSDESAMAIASARTNYAKFFPDEADFVWTNCFEGQPAACFDLVLCNPPFHQGTTVGDFIAAQMFRDAHRALRPGGALRVIGNSHLGYPLRLKRLFGNFRVVATHPKFVVCEARK